MASRSNRLWALGALCWSWSFLSLLSWILKEQLCLVLTLAQWTTWKSNSSSCNRHLAYYPEKLDTISNNFNALGSIRFIKLLGSKYCWSYETACTIAKHSLWVISSFYTALIGVRDQHSVDLKVPSSSSWGSIHHTCGSHASVSTLY